MKSITLLGICLLTKMAFAQTTADFENFNLQAGTYLNDAGAAGQFESGTVALPNDFNPDFGAWSGWAISATTDVTTPGYLNQYSAITGAGHDGSSTYAVGYFYDNLRIRLAATGTSLPANGMFITNSTYAYLSMRDGDAFAKKFGGENGDDPDFFKIVVKKYLNGQLGTDSIEFYLADFRFVDNNQDYIVDDWTYLDLEPLGMVDSLEIKMASSDVGIFGINTPTYFCVDNLTVGETPLADKEPTQLVHVDVWPNPTAESLWVNIPQTSTATASISDTYGRIHQVERLAGGKNKLNISNLPTGSFTLHIQSDWFSTSKLFIKQ